MLKIHKKYLVHLTFFCRARQVIFMKNLCFSSLLRGIILRKTLKIPIFGNNPKKWIG